MSLWNLVWQVFSEKENAEIKSNLERDRLRQNISAQRTLHTYILYNQSSE